MTESGSPRKTESPGPRKTDITVEMTIYADGKPLKTRTLTGFAGRLAQYALDHEAMFADDLRGQLVINFDVRSESIRPEARLVL